MKLNHLFIVFLFFAEAVIGDTVTVDIKEWHVPYEDSRPRDPYIAPDGMVWFCGQAGAYIAVLDPSSGVFKKYDMEDNERPHNLMIKVLYGMPVIRMDISVVWILQLV